MERLNGFDVAHQIKSQTEWLEHLYKNYFASALSWLKNSQDADDVMQNVAIKYVHEFPNLQEKLVSELEGWFFRVTYTECMDFHRSEKKRKNISFDIENIDKIPECDPFELERKYAEEQVYQDLEEMKNSKDFASNKILYELVYVDDLSYAEVAKILKKKNARVVTTMTYRMRKTILDKIKVRI